MSVQLYRQPSDLVPVLSMLAPSENTFLMTLTNPGSSSVRRYHSHLSVDHRADSPDLAPLESFPIALAVGLHLPADR